MRIRIENCAYPEYVYRVPVLGEIHPPRFRSDEERMRDEYLDAIIPPGFKSDPRIEAAVHTVVDVEIHKKWDDFRLVVYVEAFLMPNWLTQAKEPLKILNYQLSQLMSRNERDEAIASAVIDALSERW